MSDGALPTLARTVRMDLRRYDFKERERLVLETVLDFSFECGRESAVIPKLDDLAEITGISRGNVHACVQALKVIGVLSVEGTVYRVLPRSDERTWQVRPSVNLARAEALSRQLRELNGVTQGELLPRVVSLSEAVAHVAVEAALKRSAVPESGTHRGREQGADVPNLGTSVPESGTGVPKLGTPLSFKREEALSTSSLKRCCAVRDGGRLPDVHPDELHQVPHFHDNAQFQAWCRALETKWAGWMGTGNADTWAESFGALWWRRWQQDRARFAAVWNETLQIAREGRIIESLGGCAHDLWVNARVGSRATRAKA